MGRSGILALVALSAIMTATAEGQEVGDARRGLTYARNVCAECHNVLDSGAASPSPWAPPFKKVAKRPACRSRP